MGLSVSSVILTLIIAVLISIYVNEDPYHPYENKGPHVTPMWGVSHRLETDRGYDLHLYGFRKEGESAKVNILLVHGTSHHCGWYSEFSKILSKAANANVFGLDLHGHGLSGGVRGTFDFNHFLTDVEDAGVFIQRLTGQHTPIVLLGFSQGGEVVFQALQKSDLFAGCVSMNILLPSELNMVSFIGFMKSPIAAILEIFVQDYVKFPLKKLIDYKTVTSYDKNPLPYEQRMRNPLMIWNYGFKSYRTVWNYKPDSPPSTNQKPLLVTCGEKDTVVPATHCEKCFDLIGGPKDLYIIPGGEHQPVITVPQHFADTISSWIQTRVLQKDLKSKWKPPKLIELN
ncbi:monoacylglycerol lipase-like isoform X1 [Glandiceps talaboti]